MLSELPLGLILILPVIHLPTFRCRWPSQGCRAGYLKRPYQILQVFCLTHPLLRRDCVLISFFRPLPSYLAV